MALDMTNTNTNGLWGRVNQGLLGLRRVLGHILVLSRVNESVLNCDMS